MFRHSSKFIARKSSTSGFKWFFYGLIFGGALIFLLLQLRRPAETVQLMISTPEPTLVENPEEYLWSESGNTGIIEPKANTMAVSPLTVKGMAKAEKNEVHSRLISKSKDKKGQIKEEILAETVVKAAPPDAGFYGPFEASLEFETNAREGALEIFGVSGKDGGEVDKLVVPLTF